MILAFMIDGRPLAVNCRLTSESPVRAFTKDRRIQDLAYPCPVILVATKEDKIVRIDAEATSFEEATNGFTVNIQRINVKPSDRRFYTRYPIEVPVSLRAVCEVKESTVISVSMGTTKDVSLGGCWLEVEPVVPMGSIIECKFKIEGEEIWTLAMIAHENPNRGGNGVEFLDFYGDSKDKLERLLKKVA